MIRNYLRRSLWRNKTRSLLIMIGIIVSIMLVSGVNIASNRMALHMIKEQLDEVKVDFTLKSGDDNIKANLEKLDQLSLEMDEYITSYVVGSATNYQSIYIPDSTSINWSAYLSNNDYSLWRRFNFSIFCGLYENIFEDPQVQSRFGDLIQFNTPLNLSQDGVYIDSGFAQYMQLNPGDNLTIRVVFQDYVNIGGNYEQVNYLINSTDIPVLGTFDISDMQNILQIVGTSDYYFQDGSRLILGNISYIQNLIDEMELMMYIVKGNPDYSDSNLWENGGTEFTIKYAVLLDHSEMLNNQPSEIADRLEYISTRISRIGEGKFYSISTSLYWVVRQVQLQMILYQTLFLFISLPVLILGWYLCKTNWLLSYQQRRREIALLKVKGGITQQLKSMFFLEALIIGGIGGIIGILGGNLTSTLVLSRIYPQALQDQTTISIIGQIFSGEYMKLSTWLIGIIGGIIISILAVRKPLKEFTKMEPIEGLAKYHEISYNAIPKKKMDWILLIVGGFPILISIIGDLLMDQANFGLLMLLFPLISISTSILPFAPFILTYALVKLLCRNISLFQKIVSQISKLFSKNISVFTSKSIVNNQARSFRLVFIVAMALSFLVLSATVEGSEMNYQNQRNTILSGDGVRVDLYSPRLGTDGIDNLVNYLQSNFSDVNVRGLNWLGTLYNGRLKTYSEDYNGIYDDYGYMETPKVSLISAENYTKDINIYSKWINSEYGVEVISKLSQGNYCLIPDTMVEQGYKVGENLTILYNSANESISEPFEIDIKILGSYSAFPLTDEYSWNPDIIIANQTIQDGVIKYITVTFYPSAGTSLEEIDIDKLITLIKEWDSNGYVEKYQTWNEGVTDVTGSLLRFLNLESLYLLTIVTFGIAIIMYISINEKSHDMGLLRARGVEKKVIYKIQIAEGLTLILLGTIFTFTGILGGASIIIQLNNLTGLGISGALQREIYIEWGKLLLQLAASIFAFIVSIAIAVAIETRKSDVSKIGDLLRISA
ncbi:FtsX-like permease family protein [Candidatus Harpocratesius sp.]